MNSTPHSVARELISLLNKHDAYASLPEIVAELERELYRNQDVTVVSAVALSAKDRDEVEQQVVRRWGEHRIVYAVDPGLLSGLMLKFRDSLIDLSGRTSLRSLEQELK